MLTEGQKPMKIIAEWSNGGMKIDAKVFIRHLNDLQKDNTDIILLIDLIKRMLEEVPQKRDSCQQLIKHAVFMKFKKRRFLLRKYVVNHECFVFDSKFHPINKNKLHLNGLKDTDKKFVDELDLRMVDPRFPQHVFEIENHESCIRLLLNFAFVNSFLPLEHLSSSFYILG